MRASWQGMVAGAGCALVFGLPFLVAGLVVLGMVARSWWVYFDSADWVEVEALIETVEFKEDTDSDGTAYSVDCTYSYEYGGTRHAATRVAVTEAASSEHDLHRERYERLELHRERERPFPALVDPEDPARAILFRERDLFMYVGIPFGLVFAGIGGAILTACVVGLIRERR